MNHIHIYCANYVVNLDSAMKNSLSAAEALCFCPKLLWVDL